VSKPRGWRPLNDDEKQEIVRRYAAGEGLATLAKEYHRTKETLRPILGDAGVYVRGPGSPKGTTWTPERRERFRRTVGTPEHKARMRLATLKRMERIRESPACNTPIERRMQDALKVARIGFRTQRLLLDHYLVDILINQAPVVIEADGAVHRFPLQMAKDELRDAALTEAGYRVFRFTGTEINHDATACVQRLIKACGLTPDAEPVYDIRTSFTGEDHPLWKGGKQEYTCATCGEKFLAQPKHRKAERAYCNPKCAAQTRRGKPRDAETVEKIRAGNRGQKRGPLSPETKAKMGAAVSAALKGKPKSAEHVAKVAAANRGRPKSPETRAKISASLKRHNAKSDHEIVRAHVRA
jgi:very-short-patch-repair endonuclease